MSYPDNPRLLLIGWAGADWRLIQPLVDAGRMPHLQALIEAGTMGNLLTLAPMVPPSLWTGIATGRRADSHGILSQAMPGANGFGIRPVASTDLGAPPLWQILADAGRSAAAVGWPVTHPATVFDGLVVSEAFAEARGKGFDDWPLREHSVSDPELQETLFELRLHPTEVTPEQALPFVPQGARIDQETDERLPLLVAALARMASIHGAGTWIAEHRDWDLLAVHLDLIEHLSSAFLQYRTPRMPHVTETDFSIYRDVVDGAYQFMDLLLGRYLELVGPQTHVMLVSDHGFLTDQLRPPPATGQAADRLTRNYREFGVLVMSGPGIKRDELVFGANLLDIAPTALTLLGEPLSRELEGRVLTDAFVDPPAPDFIDCYPFPDFVGKAPPDADRDWAAGRIAELATLGYLPTPSRDPAVAAERATVRRLANLVKVLMAKRDHRRALEELEELLSLAPEHGEGRLQVAQCWYALDDTARCRAALDDLVESGLRGPTVDYLYGQLCVKEGRTQEAQEHLRRAEDGGIGGRGLLERIGRVQLEAKQWLEAERAFRKALELDPDFALALNGLGVALAGQGRHQEAIEQLMRSLGILQHQPDTHYNLGLSLAAAGRPLRAAEALRKALAIKPDMPKARQALGRIQRRIAQELAGAAKPEDQEDR